MSEVVIRVDDVCKLYKLYDKPTDRIKDSLGLTKKQLYKEHFALKNLSFEVRKGECVGIIGTNGAGKSTILKIITGVLNPTSGKVDINGRISALLELGAGFNSEYTGMENIFLNGMMLGFTREEVEAKLESILNFADIGEFINQPVKTYSSGMFVRLAFAVAINIEPEILIVDEALSVGDVFFQTKCYRKFEEFKEMGKTILFVSHDLGSINKYCDRAILLNKGKKHAEGTPKEIIDMYKRILVDDSTDEGNEKPVEEKNTKVKNDNWKQGMLINPDYIEYGDKRATILDFGVFDSNGEVSNTINKFDEFVIKMKIKFNSDIEAPIFAFTIRDLRGTELAGTNSFIEKENVYSVKKGEVIEVSFAQRMTLQKGQYMLQLGCTGYNGDDLDVYHRLYDICCIQVISDKVTVGYFDIDSNVVVNRGE